MGINLPNNSEVATHVSETTIDEEDVILNVDNGIDFSKFNDAWFKRLAEVTRERIAKFGEIVELVDFFFKRVEFQPEAVDKILKREGTIDILERAIEVLSDDSFDFYSDEIEKRLRGLVETVGIKAKFVFQPVRVAVSGRTISPPLFETIELLGREQTIERLGQAISMLEQA
ncbi:MAG: hypothetical protein HY779_06310 [Rubrobacteridae bacterium]|nr:hypothetical protein [Rubrobacteridae bacterium]